MNTENFKNIASGFQSIAFVIGLCSAGIWVLFEFRQTKYDSIDLQLTSAYISSGSENGYMIIATLKVSNDGTNVIEMKIDEESFVAARLGVDQKKNVVGIAEVITGGTFALISKDSYFLAKTIRVRPDSDNEYIFFIKVDTPGPHIIQFQSEYGNDNYSWHASTFISIE